MFLDYCLSLKKPLAKFDAQKDGKKQIAQTFALAQSGTEQLMRKGNKN